MKTREIFVLPTVLALAAGLAMAAQTSGTNSAKQTSRSDTHTTTKATVHHEMGTISSLTADELILDHAWRGREEKTTFKLDSETKKEGKIEQGDHVMVYYHFEKGRRVASELKAAPTKSGTETKKT